MAIGVVATEIELTERQLSLSADAHCTSIGSQLDLLHSPKQPINDNLWPLTSLEVTAYGGVLIIIAHWRMKGAQGCIWLSKRNIALNAPPSPPKTLDRFFQPYVPRLTILSLHVMMGKVGKLYSPLG